MVDARASGPQRDRRDGKGQAEESAQTITTWMNQGGLALDTDLGVAEALGHAIMWAVLIVITLGFGLMIFPYSFGKYALNRTYVAQDGKRVAKLVCELDVASQLGHAIFWFAPF